MKTLNARSKPNAGAGLRESRIESASVGCATRRSPFSTWPGNTASSCGWFSRRCARCHRRRPRGPISQQGCFRGPNRTRLLTRMALLNRERESFGREGGAEAGDAAFRANRATENSPGRATRRKSLRDRRKRQNAGSTHSRRLALTRLSAEIPQTENSSPGRTRTYDKAVNSRLLYQLSYRGSIRWIVRPTDNLLYRPDARNA